jgi:hypothetical protein
VPDDGTPPLQCPRPLDRTDSLFGIYSLDQGRIAEHGTFAELLAGGQFAELYLLQASQYDLEQDAS